MTKESELEFLRTIADFEDTHDMSKFNIGWNHHHVRIQGIILHNLFIKGYLDLVFRSNSYTGYRLTDKGRELLAATDVEEVIETNDEPVPTDGLFGDIIGHDEVKELLTSCLQADKPVHVLLAGPPALAKSLFLWDIEQAAGARAIWLVGSATSKAGLWDVVAEKHPQIILIDEMDKMNAADTAALLSMMEGGRLVRAKRGRELDLSNQVRVVAASNRLNMLSPELKSRFAIRKLTAYNRPDYLRVVRGVLVRREGLDDNTADEVARRLDGISQDVRDAIRVARLAPRKGVDRAIELLSIGGDSNEK